jgi:hypothetical protein
MTKPACHRTLGALCALIGILASTADAQIDPAPRQLLHFGVNAPLNGNGPMGIYAFYYWNMPDLFATNVNLRLAIAPSYVDSELGFKGLLGEHTDLAVGAAGGAFANNYQEVRNGVYEKKESFEGISGGASVSVYHLFNPDARIPLTGVLRETVTYNAWGETSDTAGNFERPDNQSIFTTRAGFRWGGKEPVLMPTLALEASAWYELDARTDPGTYGYNHDRVLNRIPERIFGRLEGHFTTLSEKHYISLGLAGGIAFDSDRLSCFRLGGVLPYTKEFPLVIPGYYYQELSAQNFGLAYGRYAYPFGSKKEWFVLGTGAAAVVRYEDGLEQNNSFNSGLGGGLGYAAASGRWKLLSLFGYGFQAERSHGRGGMTLAFAFQYNFGNTKTAGDKAYEEWQQSAAEPKGPSFR